MMKMISVKRYTADRVLTQVYFHDPDDLDLVFELARAMVSDFISSNYSSRSFVPVRVDVDGMRVL
jgi:hypothetical protein